MMILEWTGSTTATCAETRGFSEYVLLALDNLWIEGLQPTNAVLLQLATDDYVIRLWNIRKLVILQEHDSCGRRTRCKHALDEIIGIT